MLVVVSLALAGCARSAPTPYAPELSLAPRTPAKTGSVAATLPADLLVPAPLARTAAAGSRFDASRALAHAAAIASLGPRPGGSGAERRAADYIEAELRKMGFEPVVEDVPLPNGTMSRNVIATLPGASSRRVVVLGAHFDTKPGSPGANDNASGVGVVLELARQLRANPPAGTIRFVFFGSEEFLAGVKGDAHHQGSRHDAASLSAAERANTAAVISVDMVGYGTDFHARTMLRGPQLASDALRDYAKSQGIRLGFEKDLGRTGWSDHEPYELLGIPAVWLQWHEDPTYHTPRDVAGHLRRRPVDVTGRLLLGYLESLDAAALERLVDR